MDSRTKNRLVLGAALVAAVGSSLAYGWPGWVHGPQRRNVHANTKSPAAHFRAVDEAPAAPGPRWFPPIAQARGPEWVYDVFTPPEIFVDERTRQFAVARQSESGAAAEGVGLQLVAVQREPWGVQLMGFVGDEGRFLGAFEKVGTGEVFLADAGRSVPDLGLLIEQFAVERRAVPMADGTLSFQRIATAVVRDERSGTSTELTAGECAYTDELRAMLAESDTEDEAAQSLRPGEEFRGAGESYVLERVQWDPPMAELTQVSPATTSPIRVSLVAKVAPEAPIARPTN